MPEEVIYRLDYKNNAETSNYFQLFRDYGWEYIAGVLMAVFPQSSIRNKF